MNRHYIKHYPILLKLGIPIMVGQLGTIVMGFADTLMIGHHSSEELAAAGFINNIIGLVLISAMGFSYGLTPIVGALFGEGEQNRIAEKLKNSLLANNIMAILMMILMGVLYFQLHHLGLPQELLPIMRPYLLVLTLSIAPQMAFNAFKQFSDGIQDTSMPMWILLSGNVLNVIGNWILIYGKWGFPEMGLLGAGIATLISRLLMWITFSLIFHLSGRYRKHRTQFRSARINRPDLVQMNRLGLPIMLQLGMESASFSLSAIYIGWLGTTALAAHQVMITISQLCFMLYYGMSAAVAVQVSYHRGAGNIHETRRTAMAGLHLTGILGLLTAVPIFLLRYRIGYWFTEDAEVASLVSMIIIPLCIYQFGDALQCIYSNALRGMEDVNPMIWIAFVAYFVISLPLGYYFGFVLEKGIMGVWMAFPFGLTSAGIMYYIRFIRNKTLLRD